jgi:hypothetical protein
MSRHWWEDLQRGGPGNRLTASADSARLNFHPPAPPAPWGGREESQAEGLVLSSPDRETAGSSDEEVAWMLTGGRQVFWRADIADRPFMAGH